jgi:hypothetical protein
MGPEIDRFFFEDRAEIIARGADARRGGIAGLDAELFELIFEVLDLLSDAFNAITIPRGTRAWPAIVVDLSRAAPIVIRASLVRVVREACELFTGAIELALESADLIRFG